MKVLKFLPHFVIAALLALGAIDIVQELAGTRTLAAAARESARTAASEPLYSPACTASVPCPVSSAAQAAKRYLMQAGLDQASCIEESRPNFSGVLVWVFSCDGSHGCNTAQQNVCVKVDMTAVDLGPAGAWVPSARVTVQYPHAWALSALFRWVPRADRLFPKSLAATALVHLEHPSG